VSPSAGYRYTDWSMLAGLTAAITFVCTHVSKGRRRSVDAGAVEAAT
jgi:hypothetical protein